MGYDLCMSFLVQARKFAFTLDLINALTRVILWLLQNNHQLTPALTSSYSLFFENLVLSEKTANDDIVRLFKFCRAIDASLKWISQVKEPLVLYEP